MPQVLLLSLVVLALLSSLANADTATLLIPISSFPPSSAFQPKSTPFDLDLYLRHPHTQAVNLPSNSSEPVHLPIQFHLTEDDRAMNGGNGRLFLKVSWLATPDTEVTILPPSHFFDPPILRIASSSQSSYQVTQSPSRPPLELHLTLEHTYASIPTSCLPLFWILVPLAGLVVCEWLGFGVVPLFTDIVGSCWSEWETVKEMEWEKVD